MAALPTDLFTEPDPDPYTLNQLGPLRPMAGIFEGREGLDIHPVATGDEETTYIERYELQPIDAQTNGPQLLYGLRYHVAIARVEGGGAFHDQIGYWLWEPATESVLLTVAIPRGQVALASGHAAADASEFTVTANRGSTDFGICSNPFLEAGFRTTSFSMTVTTHADGTWSYDETTLLEIPGRPGHVAHRDVNTLHLVEEPMPNALARIAAAK